jgi:hypothetical protein
VELATFKAVDPNSYPFELFKTEANAKTPFNSGEPKVANALSAVPAFKPSAVRLVAREVSDAANDRISNKDEPPPPTTLSMRSRNSSSRSSSCYFMTRSLLSTAAIPFTQRFAFIFIWSPSFSRNLALLYPRFIASPFLTAEPTFWMI